MFEFRRKQMMPSTNLVPCQMVRPMADLKVKNQVLVCVGGKISDSPLEPGQMIAKSHTRVSKRRTRQANNIEQFAMLTVCGSKVVSWDINYQTLTPLMTLLACCKLQTPRRHHIPDNVTNRN